MKIFTGFFVILLVLLSGSVTFAATFTVNTTADTLDSSLGNGVCADAGGNCSLRAAISEANALGGAHTISLPAGSYTQTLVAAGENANMGGDWDTSANITINGAGAAMTILQAAASPGAATERVLEVITGVLTLTNMTVRHGRLNSPGLVAGGGIANSGQLSLVNVIVRDNQANSLEGGAIGGGIYNGGISLTLTGTTVTANSVSASLPGAGFGGGVGSSTSLVSTVTITGSSVSGNNLTSLITAASGGGLYLGGVFNLTATDSHFDNNTATSPQSSEGGGARLVSIVGPSTFNISNCTFNDNSAVSTGPGMGAAWGGGLHLYTSAVGATLTGTLNLVSIDGNRAQGNATSRGGGLYVNPISAAINMDVTNSSISQNNTNGARGGGVELSDRSSSTAASSTVTFTNTTISGNIVGTGIGGVQGTGGGVHVEMTTGPMTVNFNFVTIKGNSGFSDGGGIAHIAGNSTVNLKNSIIAGNGAGDFSGVLTSQNFNHIWTLSSGTFVPAANDTTGFDPQLGPLQNNGGPTLTHLLSAASPLVNAIPPGAGGCGTTVISDQRGLGRPFGAGCDKGAAEITGPWSLSGVIKTTTGIPIRNAAVTISGGNLPAPLTVFTGNLGTYQFTGLSGSEYTVTVSIKRYHFNVASQVFALNQNITDADFVANAPFTREVLDVGPLVKGKF